MKISEIIIDKYKLRMPPTVYYELLADVVEVEEEQEPILDKIRAEIESTMKYQYAIGENQYAEGFEKSLEIIDKYKAEMGKET